MSVEEYKAFMSNRKNVGKCADCPMNEDMPSPWNEDRLPCGQYHCWVGLHCGKGEK